LADIDRQIAESEAEMLRPISDDELRSLIEKQTDLQLLRQQVEAKLRQSEQVSETAKGLSVREREVFTLIGGGLATQQIAERLKLSASTVETYRERLKDKLELKTGNELNRAALLWVQRRGNHSPSANSSPAPQ
jgi:DNA-binding NarL/FixJ family response regulator